VAGHEAELTRCLEERGELPAGAKVLAAWSGTLVELRGTEHDDSVSDRQGAIFGITRRTGHVLSRFGVLTFDLDDVRAPHSPRRRYLWFSVAREPSARIEICLNVDGALAIAGQLSDWRPPGVEPPSAIRSPAAKSRVDPLEKARQLAIRSI
jgi:hypothetical protein